MASITWTPKARNDLESACLSMERDSRPLAQSFAARIVLAVERLVSFPRSGRIVPEFGHSDLRELIVQNYRIVYRLRENDVDLLTIQHGARPLRASDVPADINQEP